MCGYFLVFRFAMRSKSGTIDRTEFYKSVDEKNSEFGDAIFALIGPYIRSSFLLAFYHHGAIHRQLEATLTCSLLLPWSSYSIDEDHSGVLDFSEYVDALGKFCILSKEDTLKCTYLSVVL